MVLSWFVNVIGLTNKFQTESTFNWYIWTFSRVWIIENSQQLHIYTNTCVYNVCVASLSCHMFCWNLSFHRWIHIILTHDHPEHAVLSKFVTWQRHPMSYFWLTHCKDSNFNRECSVHLKLCLCFISTKNIALLGCNEVSKDKYYREKIQNSKSVFWKSSPNHPKFPENTGSNFPQWTPSKPDQSILSLWGDRVGGPIEKWSAGRRCPRV